MTLIGKSGIDRGLGERCSLGQKATAMIQLPLGSETAGARSQSNPKLPGQRPAVKTGQAFKLIHRIPLHRMGGNEISHAPRGIDSNHKDGKINAQPISMTCRDGYEIHGHFWRHGDSTSDGTIIINPATGVLAKYYHLYARFLAGQGFDVLTYDYRGIGASRPARMRGSRIRWRDWGELDFDAAVHWARDRDPNGMLAVVGHSIGGFLPGLAAAAIRVDRLLTVGAQYAYWRDYAAPARVRLVLKWHLAMPIITWAVGYFPGRRLGWLEDLPAGIAYEWSFRSARFENSYPLYERGVILGRFSAVRAPILAVGVTDDEFGTPGAITRALDYYIGSERTKVILDPVDLGFEKIGHFNLFHTRHEYGFWLKSSIWLRSGINPWPSVSPTSGS